MARIQVREPYPPHGVLFEFEGEAVTYGSALNDVNQAAFNLSRGDPAVSDMTLVMPGRQRVGQCVSMSLDDGSFPWLGWVVRSVASPGGPYYRYQAKDHGYLLKRHRTASSGTYSGSAGRVLLDLLAELRSRAGAAFTIHLDKITEGGPYLDFTPNAKDALAAVNQIAQHADYEWWWEYELLPEGAKVYLRFEQRRGSDRRGDVIWEEGRQLNVREYTQDADGYSEEVLVVGGTGEFGSRSAVSVNTKGDSRGGEGSVIDTSAPLIAAGSPIFGGSSVIVSRPVTDKDALKASAAYYSVRPEEFGEQLSGDLMEDEADMKVWEVGDKITVKLTSTDLGLPVDLPVRIMGVNFDPDARQHSVEFQVRQELIG